MCSLPRVLSHCLQDEILASTEGGFFLFLFSLFLAQSQSRSKEGEKYQPPLLNILLDHLGPKGLRQNRDPCPKISSSV